MSLVSNKELSNIKISGRIKQVAVLIIAILLGILLSKSADAYGAVTTNHQVTNK